MQPDMLLLAERLVVAVERMSQDVNNISAYVYDLSYSVQDFINEKKAKTDISQFSSHGCPAATSENAWQDDGISVSLIDNLEDKNILAGNDASVNVDHSENSDVLSALPQGIKVEELTENERNYDSCGVHNISGVERKNVTDVNEIEDVIDISDDSLPCQEETEAPVLTLAQEKKGFLEEIIQRPHLQSSGLSSSLETPSPSSESPLVEAPRIKTEESFLTNSCPPERGTVFLQNVQCQMPLAIASCSTAKATMDQTGAADKRLLEGSGGGQVTGVRQGQHTAPSEDRTCTSYEVPQRRRVTLGSTSMESSCTGNGGEIRKRAFECFKCKKQFALNSMLVNHVRQHHTSPHLGERPHKCSQCGKSFMAKRVLSIHMKFHKSERPFKCMWCERAFVQSSDLKKHMRSHTGEKPFSCSVCGKSFALKGNLSQHMITHSRAQPYVCEMCGEHYNSSEQFSEHVCHLHGATSSGS